jgi:peroxiredoxin
VRADIVPGGRFPDYELPDQDGVRHRLSDLQSGQPMILVLSRGNFCPKDHQQHRELVELVPHIRVAYTSIATISTDEPVTCKDMQQATGATWTFLADPERRLQHDLDIRESSDPLHNPMVPHTLVLAPGLVIHSVYCGYWFWGRPSRDELRRDLRDVLRTTRHDFDPTAGNHAHALPLGAHP